jgi:hypothetical protein
MKGCIPEAIFKSQIFDINIKMYELHTIYRLRMLDITMMTVMCTLVYTCDEEKRPGFLNPTQINQLELNPVINKKSEMVKGMSKKKRAIAIKKSTTRINQRENRSCINPHRSNNSAVEDRQCIMLPYNFE